MVESVGRVFVALGLPPELRRLVADAPDVAQLPGRRVDEADLHITLRFIGDVDEVSFDRLLMELDDQTWPPPYRLRLTSLGAFPNDRSATVAWIGVDGSPSLVHTHSLVEEACDAAGLGTEERPFRPHVTVSRLRPPADLRPVVAASQRLGASFDVSQVVVLRSHLGGAGPRYEPLEWFPLG